MLMQNLNSFHFVEQFAISPKRYIDLSWLPRTILFCASSTSGSREGDKQERETGVLLHKRKLSKALMQEGMSSGVGCSSRRRASSWETAALNLSTSSTTEPPMIPYATVVGSRVTVVLTREMHQSGFRGPRDGVCVSDVPLQHYCRSALPGCEPK